MIAREPKGRKSKAYISAAGRRPSPRRRLALLCLGVALLTGLSLRSPLAEWQDSEKQKTELYWNGYVQMYLDVTGGFHGLDEQLGAQGYLHAQERGLALSLFEGIQRQKVQVLLAGSENAIPGRLLPITQNGEVAGYTLVGHPPAVWAPYVQYGVPFAAALLLYGIGEWVLARSNKARTAERIALAKELAASLAASPHPRRKGRQLGASDTLEVGQTEALPELRALSQAAVPANASWESAMAEATALAERNERLETVRRTMVADIAHELRTPISIMRTTLDHSLQTGSPLEIGKIANLHDETLRLTRLVRELQELSLAESGHLPLQKSWFPLADMVAEVLEALSVEGEERGIAFTLSDKGRTMLYGDEARIRQMVINLVGNAFRHARSRVDARIFAEGSRVVLEIEDDGMGMETEETERVFERFYRAPSGNELKRKERSSGLGLGLAIVREFSRAHGGDSSVRSQYGQGTVFSVVLPVMEE